MRMHPSLPRYRATGAGRWWAHDRRDSVRLFKPARQPAGQRAFVRSSLPNLRSCSTVKVGFTSAISVGSRNQRDRSSVGTELKGRHIIWVAHIL